MTRLALDSHVHLHPNVPLEAAFDAAAANFPAADLRLLCLTDMCGVNSAERLRTHRSGAWTVEETKGSFLARGPREISLFLLPGRQIVSSEGLELLALGLESALPDRKTPLSDLMDAVTAAGAVPVLPWGVGKWSGRRGEIVAELLRGRSDFGVSDNGNRLQGSSEPALLRAAREKGLPVLLGSDPLPLPGAHHRIAACGNSAEGVTEDTPSQLLREILSRPGALTPYGRLTPPLPFFLQQVRMQLRKHLPGKGASA